MAIATIDAADVVKTGNIPGVDNVFTMGIPKEYISDLSSTLVLITDANANPDLYGSGHFHALSRMVEVQVFYKADVTVDPETTLVSLYKAFESAGWTLGQSHGFQRDPDTDGLYVTFYVTDEKAINN